MKEMRRVLKANGVLGVRDPDYATLLLEPATELLRDALALYQRVQEYNGGSLYYACHQRQLLMEAGFARTEGYAAAICFANQQATRRVFDIAWNPFFREPAFVDTAIEQGWADQALLDAIVAEWERWAERPDAFFALTHCAAIGLVKEDKQ